MFKDPKKNLFINFMLAAITSIIWIKFKNLSFLDSLICFAVVFFVLFSIDVFSNWTVYRAALKGKKIE